MSVPLSTRTFVFSIHSLVCNPKQWIGSAHLVRWWGIYLKILEVCVAFEGCAAAKRTEQQCAWTAKCLACLPDSGPCFDSRLGTLERTSQNYSDDENREILRKTSIPVWSHTSILYCKTPKYKFTPTNKDLQYLTMTVAWARGAVSKALCPAADCWLAATEAVTRHTDPQEAVTQVTVSFFACPQWAA
jgi:hypothetical protein